jgi:hypothetical protein
MVIESRMIVGAVAALVLVGGALVGSTFLFSPPAHSGSVEIQQVSEPSWAVEIKELGQDQPAPSTSKTAAAR